MDELFAFLLAFLFSFFGSLQLGPVNFAVVSTTFQYGRVNAKWVAFGGIIPEFIYSTLAIFGVDFLARNETLFNFITWLIIPVFLLLAYFFWNKRSVVERSFQETQAGKSFIKGLFIALLNPQLIVFWSTILIYFHDFLPFQGDSSWRPKCTFVIGTAAGAFSLFVFLISITEKRKEGIKRLLNMQTNKLMAIIFLVLALISFARNLISI